MATEKIRVGIIGANMRHGWESDAHIPALSAPEFEITAIRSSVTVEGAVRIDASSPTVSASDS